MSLSPYFYLEKYSKSRNKWELIAPLVWNHDHTKQIPADLFPYNGCHDLFDALGYDRGGFAEAPVEGVHRWRPNDLSEEVKKEIEEFEKYDPWDGADFHAPVKWVTYADLYINLLKYPQVTDYDYEHDEDEEPKKKPNPVNALISRVDAFLSVSEEDWDLPEEKSLIRVVFWIV